MPYKDKNKQKEYMKKYEDINRDKHTKKRTEWRQKNPDKVKLWTTHKSERHRQILHDLKINGCAICGYDKCDNALSFHHTNPEDKLFQITSRCISFKHERIADELNKCILLCANCHREIEEQNRQHEKYEADNYINIYRPKIGEK